MNQKHLARLLKLDPIQWKLMCLSLKEEELSELKEALRVKATKRSTKIDQIVAHHEGGHAVALVRLGIEFNQATIVRDVKRRTDGHVTGTRPPWLIRAMLAGQRNKLRLLDNANVTQRIEHDVIFSLAGGEAQRLFFPRSSWKKGCNDDMQDVGWLLGLLHQDDDDTAHKHYRYLEHRTRMLVSENRDHIKLVAKALLERKTLTSDEVRRVMFPAVDDNSMIYFVDRVGQASDQLLCLHG